MIHMVPSFSFTSTDKCNSWSNYQLKYLPKRAEILSMYNDQIQRLGGRRTFCFNGMWYLSRFRRKAGLFRSCLSSALFSRSQQSRVGTLLLNAQRKKTIFMKKDLIDIVDGASILHLFANQQIEQSNTYKCSSLKRCGSRP